MNDKLEQIMLDYKKKKEMYDSISNESPELINKRIDDILGHIYDTLRRCAVK
jgi:hypothetical protein